MKDRIEIDGTWYVKEQTESVKEFDTTYYQSAICESDTASFEFCYIQRDKSLKLMGTGTQSIEYTNKETKVSDYWDSEDWISEIPNGWKDKELLEMMSRDDLEMLKSFITELISIDLL
jgi:hypothetical protein